MRKIILLTNISLDGYFEAPGGDLSWFKGSFDTFSSDSSAQVDTFLLGHRTYEMMKSYWPTPQAAQAAPEVARVMNEAQKVVVSRQPFEPGWQNVTILSGDPVERVRQLKEGPGQGIMMFGSNTLVVTLMQAGLIDQFNILVNPVALGKGASIFTGLPHPIELKLVETRSFPSGTALLTYVPLET